jgi:hypothetical protein
VHNKLKLIKIFIVAIIFLAGPCCFAKFIYVSFDESMQRLEDRPVTTQYNIYKKIFEENNPDLITPTNDPTIPKIIHQIWIGPYKMPEEFAKYAASWQELHPDWQYKLWQDRDVDTLDFSDRDLYDKSSTYQEKAAILKYAILKNFGGLYADIDCKPVRKFDYLHYGYSFYTGILPPNDSENNVWVSGSIIGAAPNNLIVTQTLKQIRAVWENAEQAFIQEANMKDNESIMLLYKTRAIESFNESLRNNIALVKDAIVLPPTYFNINIRNQILDPYLEALGINKRERYYYIIHRETLATERQDGTRLVVNLSSVKTQENFFRRIMYRFKEIFLDFYHKFSY